MENITKKEYHDNETAIHEAKSVEQSDRYVKIVKSAVNLISTQERHLGTGFRAGYRRRIENMKNRDAFTPLTPCTALLSSDERYQYIVGDKRGTMIFEDKPTCKAGYWSNTNGGGGGVKVDMFTVFWDDITPDECIYSRDQAQGQL